MRKGGEGRGIRSSVIFVVDVAVNIIFFVVIGFVSSSPGRASAPLLLAKGPARPTVIAVLPSRLHRNAPWFLVLLSSAVACLCVFRVWALFPGMSLPDPRPCRYSLSAAGRAPVLIMRAGDSAASRPLWPPPPLHFP